MITCVLVDDEMLARDALELMLVRYFNDRVQVVAKAESLKEGVLAICRHKPDIVFLDIEMHEESGFNIFSYFQDVNFAVIFVTAFREYAIKAFKVSALDYILKPVNVEELKNALDLYEKKKNHSVPQETIEKLISTLQPATGHPEKIALPTLNGFLFERTDSIMYCIADQNYTKVYLKNGRELLISKPLNTIEKLLPPQHFFRIHKSHLVNLNYVESYSRTEGFHIVLEDGKKLDVATRRNEEFIRVITQKRSL